MPRKVRQLVDEGVYHVFNRGNDRRLLFHDQADYQYFLDKLHAIKNELSVGIFHYCLMSNHFHLLVHVLRGNDLVKLMHRLQLGYARYYKKRYGYVGHVFQERFRSPMIAKDSYYLQCGRYIEKNPVQARIVQKPCDYQWSSAKFYMSGIEDRLITPNIHYESLGENIEQRQKRYAEFLVFEEPYAAIVDEMLIKV